MSEAERAQYRAFRTGLTFRAVRRMMRVGGDDRSKWVYLTRRCVLRYWHRLKLDLFNEATGRINR